MSDRVPFRRTAPCPAGAPRARPPPPHGRRRGPAAGRAARRRQGRPAAGRAARRPPARPPPPLPAGPWLPALRSFSGATEPAASPRGNPALRVPTGHARADTHTHPHPHKGDERCPALPRSKRLPLGGWKRRCSQAARPQPFRTAYGFPHRSCTNPCASPDKGRARGIAGPGSPGPRRTEDA